MQTLRYWGGGGSHPDPEIRGGVRSPNFLFSAFRKGQVFGRSRTDDLGFLFSYAHPTVSKEKIEVLSAG